MNNFELFNFWIIVSYICILFSWNVWRKPGVYEYYHTYNTNIWRLMQGDCQDCKVSLDYTVRCSPIWANSGTISKSRQVNKWNIWRKFSFKHLDSARSPEKRFIGSKDIKYNESNNKELSSVMLNLGFFAQVIKSNTILST